MIVSRLGLFTLIEILRILGYFFQLQLSAGRKGGPVAGSQHCQHKGENW
jgi:hypothetical protein